MCPTAVRAQHQSRFWKSKDKNAVSSRGTESTNFINSLADLGDVDLIEDLNEDELGRYLDPSQSTATEAQTNIVIRPASLKVL